MWSRYADKVVIVPGRSDRDAPRPTRDTEALITLQSCSGFRMRRLNRITVAALLLLSYVTAAARPAAGFETWLHKGGRTSGHITNLICEPFANATITFSGGRLTQVVTPDRDGRFIVELPAGKYEVTVSTHERGEIAAEALVFHQARDGRLRLWVDTGTQTVHGCYDESPEDLLIPDERGVVGDTLLGRPPAPKP